MYKDIIGPGNKEALTYDAFGNPISSLGGALDIHTADVHIEMPNRLFANFPGINTTTLSNNASSGDRSIDIQAADYASFIIGQQIFIKDGATEETGFITITSKPGSPTLNIYGPLDFNYNSDSTTIEEINTNLASANGSLADPVSFILKPRLDQVWHLTRANLSATSTAESSINEFLSLPALSNGVVFRKCIDGVLSTYTNWKADKDIIEDLYDLDPVPRPPAGKFGQRARWWFKRADVIIRLNGNLGDYAEFLIQNNLTGSTLEDWQIKGQGHIEGAQ